MRYSVICLQATGSCAGRLAEWQPGFSLKSCETAARGLAAWAVSIGMQYTGRPFYDSQKVSLAPSIGEITYLAKSIRRRILHRLDQIAQ